MSDKGSRFTGNLARGARNTASASIRNARRLGRLAKVNMDLKSEKDNLRRLYTDVGELYYESHRDDPEGFFVQLFQQIDASLTAIGRLEGERSLLKTENRAEKEDDSITVDILAEDASEPASIPEKGGETEVPPETPEENSEPGPDIPDETE